MSSDQSLTDYLLSKVEAQFQKLELPEKPASLYEPYTYTMQMGGKRIRPLMTLLASGLCNGEVDDALPAALAVEVLHNFTLVHDDIMDSADTRRGMPSVFKKWDENTAILSGDLMFAEALRFLCFYGYSNEYSKADYANLNSTFLNAIITVCEGQALDMEFVDRDDVTLNEYIEMISGKTSALLAASLKMGGIAAKANKEEQKILFELGMDLGVAFQIQDDYLDATADPEKFGKKPGGDIFEGKKTYLTILALERANENEQLFINNVLKNDSPSEDDVSRVLDIMDSTKTFTDVKSAFEEKYIHSLELLETFEDSEYKQELKNLLIFLKNRDH